MSSNPVRAGLTYGAAIIAACLLGLGFAAAMDCYLNGGFAFP